VSTCPSCGAENPAGNRFCGDCGTVLGVLLKHAIDIAERADAWQPFNRALYNRSYNLATRDDFLGSKRIDELSLEHAHRRGDRVAETLAKGQGLLITAGEIAVELGDFENAFSMFGEWDRMQPSDRTPVLEAHRERFRAAAAEARGEHDVAEAALVRSIELFREVHRAFELAIAQLELGALLDRVGRRDEAEPLFADARATFERLRARPSLDRLDEVERPRSPA